MVSVKKSITQSSLEISPIWIPNISDIMTEVKVISVYTMKLYEGVKLWGPCILNISVRWG